MSKLLDVQNLHVDIRTDSGVVHAVRGVDFTLNSGETLAVVGESGSGKSITFKSIMGLLPIGGKITEGSVQFDGRELANMKQDSLRQIRGREISMIFQDPLTSLNPTMQVGKQIEEVLKVHRKEMKPEQRKQRALELLGLVGIPSPEERYKQYPHQFSGGMRQRVMISIALACDPKILIADEPTTALDVTIQAQILDLMKELQKKINTSIIIVTHNLGVVASVADRVAVMYGGRFVEIGCIDEVFYKMGHPYTEGLLASIPKLNEREQQLYSIAGSPPDLMSPPKGCPFAARCQYCMAVCEEFPPPVTSLSDTHSAACWLFDPRAKGQPGAKEAAKDE